MHHRRFLAGFAALFVILSPAGAHYNMLLPDRASAKKGDTVTFTYQWGHPFEHQLFDAPTPQGIWVLAPNGKVLPLKPEPIQLDGADGKKVTGFRFTFTPEERGDFVFFLRTPPIWMEEDEEYLHDSVKVILHVQAQKGWDQVVPVEPGSVAPLQMLPLTRPYGLQPGIAFQTQAVSGPASRPMAGVLVEVERMNPTPPASLPPDEHITRAAKTDPNGVATATLTEPGWWALTAQHRNGTHMRNGKAYPVRERATVWVFVDEKASRSDK
jgi:uncharacterized GH25 family protein